MMIEITEITEDTSSEEILFERTNADEVRTANQSELMHQNEICIQDT